MRHQSSFCGRGFERDFDPLGAGGRSCMLGGPGSLLRCKGGISSVDRAVDVGPSV
jgi:hypothetical protein